ncbi:MAG: tripartite tricarboxylate transporter substrate binding protein [Hyphomicrobiales bacterium]|nr:tripartite tricarboxylate transporter substrate binding protein [Hyphomicrobiales bacterium]
MKSTWVRSAARALLVAAPLFAALALPGARAAEPLKVIVPWGAGGSSDTFARTLALSMRETLGREIVIINKPGAAGTLGTTLVAQAEPDGNTIGFSALAPFTMQPHLRKLAYDADSFAYVCEPAASPMVLAVRDESPFKSVADAVTFAAANPGKLKYGSPGPGSLPHLAMVELGLKAGVKWTHLPAKGGDMGNVRNLLGGHIDMVPIQILPLASNPIRALAVFSDARLDDLKDVPTMKELGYDVSHVIWNAMVAPKGTPEAKLAEFEAACQTAAATPAYKALLKKVRVPDTFKGRAALTAYAKAESDKFKVLFEQAGMKKKD